MGYKITVGDVTREYPEGTRIIELAKEFQPEDEYPYILCEYNSRLKELNNPLTEDGTIKFLSSADKNGRLQSALRHCRGHPGRCPKTAPSTSDRRAEAGKAAGKAA